MAYKWSHEEREEKGGPGTDGGANRGPSRHDACVGVCTYAPPLLSTYYMLGLAAQAHAVSLVLRKALPKLGGPGGCNLQGTQALGLCVPGMHVCAHLGAWRLCVEPGSAGHSSQV